MSFPMSSGPQIVGGRGSGREARAVPRPAPWRRPPRFWHGRRGASVAELMVVVSAAAVLCGLAGVGLGTMAPVFNLDAGARMAVMALNQGRVQAITRGHAVDVVFEAQSFRITDVSDALDLDAGDFPPQVACSSPTVVPFTPLGTIDAALASPPVTVTLAHGDASRSVTVGLTGSVEVQ